MFSMLGSPVAKTGGEGNGKRAIWPVTEDCLRSAFHRFNYAPFERSHVHGLLGGDRNDITVIDLPPWSLASFRLRLRKPAKKHSPASRSLANNADAQTDESI
jgi:hypothetical protein